MHRDKVEIRYVGHVSKLRRPMPMGKRTQTMGQHWRGKSQSDPGVELLEEEALQKSPPNCRPSTVSTTKVVGPAGVIDAEVIPRLQG
jgi:hypothetical protein